MAEPCEACGLKPWFATTGEFYDATLHCLAHTQAKDGKKDCESREIVRLRAEVARLRGAGNMIVEQGGSEPVHLWFGLSYANYYAVQRSLLQAMPLEWQRRFVVLLDELYDAARDLKDRPDSFRVLALDDQNRFITDPYRQYRHVRLQLNVEGSGGHG